MSSPSSISIAVIPVFLSPFIIAHGIGAAPLYFGSSEACRLTQPRRGSVRISGGSIFPYATTTISSGLTSCSLPTNEGSLIFAGCMTFSPAAAENSFTGGGESLWLLPFRLSGCVTTAASSCPALRSASSDGTANEGVPKNTIRIYPITCYFSLSGVSYTFS